MEQKKTHQKTFPLLESKMPSAGSAYLCTDFIQNDRIIANLKNGRKKLEKL
jgi:hypothetical protein